MARYGYARISTCSQRDDSQLDALRAAGCERNWTDTAPGKLARRPKWDNCLDHLRRGNELVVTPLSRMARRRHPAGEPLRGHTGDVSAVAVGVLPDADRTPVIVSGSDDATVRVWRLADRTLVIPPLDLPKSVRDVAVYGNIIVTAAGADIAVHQPATPITHTKDVRCQRGNDPAGAIG